jgi:hypothetical protein
MAATSRWGALDIIRPATEATTLMRPASSGPPASFRWHLFAALAVAAAVCAPMTAARAQADPIDGAWQQIESNAGACPACRISFDQGDASWTVTANNGWSARVIARPGSDATRIAGIGRWNSGLSGGFAGKPFEVDFVVRDQRLYMSMLVDMKNGAKRVIRGVYGRIWFGA